MKNYKVDSKEAIFMMLIILINTVVLNVPNLIILSSRSSAIINVIYIGIIAFLFSLIITRLFNIFLDKDIIDISHYVGGNIFKTFVGLCFLTFFLLLSIIAVRYLTSSIKIIYYNNSPLTYITLFFLVPAVIINKIGLKAISKTNIILLTIVILCFLFLFISSYESFTFSKIFPLLGNGLNKTFFYGITNIFAFTNFIFLFFLPPLLKKIADFKHIAISSTVIGVIILTFSIATFVLTLPIVTESDEMLSIYLLSRMVGFGNFLERLDAFFIFSWIITLLSSLSISIFFIIQILKKLLNLQDERALASPVGLIILGGCLLIKNYSQIKFLGNYVYRYGFLVLVFGIGFGTLVFANIKYKNNK